MMIKNGVDDISVEGVVYFVYKIFVCFIYVYSFKVLVFMFWWCFVGYIYIVFVVECFIDEFVYVVGCSLFDFCCEFFLFDFCQCCVFDFVIEKSGYGKIKFFVGCVYGIVVYESFGSFVVQVVEVFFEDGWFCVYCIIVVVDCGIVINLFIIEVQVQGFVIYVLSVIFYGEIMFKDGCVQQKNFYEYEVVCMNEMFVVDVYIIVIGDKMGGIGEIGVFLIFVVVFNGFFMFIGKCI